MKYLVTAFLLVTTNVAIANSELPKSLQEGGVISVTLNDGNTYKFDLTKWKVVERNPQPAVRVQSAPPIPMPQVKVVEKEKIVEKEVLKHHRFKLILGAGPNGFATEEKDDNLEVENDTGFLLGLGYDYHIKPEISVGAGVLSNRSLLFNIGYNR